MPKANEASCAQPAAGPVLPETEEFTNPLNNERKEKAVLARVGQKAPDFEATAFVDDGFKNLKLSDYAGKWVVLCFYPGDFTFV